MNTRSIRFRLTVWYTALHALLLMLSATSTWFGLKYYLTRSMSDSLAKQAQQIGESLLMDVNASGESYVIEEINEHYSPEQNEHFVRVTRADGSVLYISGKPISNGFDPAQVSPASLSLAGASTREVRLYRSGLLVHSLPVTTRDGTRFLVETGIPLDSIENTLRGLLLTLAAGLPLMIMIAIAGGYWIMRRALSPLKEIAVGAERITSRNLNDRLPVERSGDELERVSVALNEMIGRLEQSFEHIRRFTADASHDLRTPLTVLRGELEAVAQKSEINPQVGDTISSALEETDRLIRIVESLLAISRLDAGEARMESVRFDLAALASMTTEHVRLLAKDKNIRLDCSSSERVEIEGDQARIKQVIVNLVDNAIKYTHEGGTIHVRVFTEHGNACLEVADTGIGIPIDAQRHLFERFYRVDKSRSRQIGGAGLGLAIVKSIVTGHGGDVRVESSENRGSRFRVLLPIDQDDRTQALENRISREGAAASVKLKPN